MGQRVTATTVHNKMGNIEPKMNSAVVKLIIEDVEKYLIAAMNITNEEAKEIYKKYIS